jgi:hypothetical protein
MDELSNKNAELVSVLNDSWNTSCSHPVVVKVTHLISQLLHTIWRQSQTVEIKFISFGNSFLINSNLRVVNDVVGCWAYSALTNGLRDEEEVIAGKIDLHELAHS